MARAIAVGRAGSDSSRGERQIGRRRTRARRGPATVRRVLSRLQAALERQSGGPSRGARPRADLEERSRGGFGGVRVTDAAAARGGGRVPGAPAGCRLVLPPTTFDSHRCRGSRGAPRRDGTCAPVCARAAPPHPRRKRIFAVRGPPRGRPPGGAFRVVGRARDRGPRSAPKLELARASRASSFAPIGFLCKTSGRGGKRRIAARCEQAWPRDAARPARPRPAARAGAALRNVASRASR